MNWVTILLFLLLCAVLFRAGLLAYALYTLVGVLLAGRWLARHASRSITAQRQCSALEAEIGDVVSVEVRLNNKSAIPIPWALVEDLLPQRALVHTPPSLELAGRRTMLVSLPGRSARTLRYQLKANRRGYYQIGPAVVETGDVFGLHRRYHLLSRPHFLTVYPKIVPIEGYDIASRRPVGEVRLAHRLFEDVTRLAGVRDYRPGDRFNTIHWPATARTGSLQTKVFEPSCVAGATLVLDFHQDGYDKRYEPYRSELAVTAAASLAHVLYEWNQQVGLVTNGRDAADRIRWEGWSYDLRSRDAAIEQGSMLPRSERLRPLVIPTARGPEVLRSIRDALARLELTDGLRLHELLLETHARLPRDAAVIVLVAKLDAASTIALGNLVRQGYAVTVLVSIYEEADYAEVAGPLIAEGVNVRQLRNEESITRLCHEAVLATVG
ncbi:MAG: membrane protein [Pirellulaceae bacterium]|nr:MAG: membrane protein [Pirellulaceae bacterium]